MLLVRVNQGFDKKPSLQYGEDMRTLTIAEGKEKQLLRHHPWVFSGAIERPSSALEEGIYRVETFDSAFIAWGWYDPKAHIPLRLLSWNEKEVIDHKWWKRTISASVLRRKHFFSDKSGGTTTFRIIFGEADFLPGVVVDVYGTMLNITISARVAWTHRDLIVTTLSELLSPSLILISVDPAFSGAEQLKETTLYFQDGAYFTPSKRLDAIRFREDSLYYEVIPGTGQKSGFYCDQRENRKIVGSLSAGATVLDGCSYTGSFALHALRGGAESVDLVDSSSSVLKQAVHHVRLNERLGAIPQGSSERFTTTTADIFEHLREIEADHYDLIILDPPKLAPTKAHLEAALKAYKDMNRLAMEKIKHNGIIATFSCSGAVSSETLQMVLAWASVDARVEVQILTSFTQPEDHPVRLSFEESAYLNGFLVRVLKD